jgi:hypothetical protein
MNKKMGRPLHYNSPKVKKSVRLSEEMIQRLLTDFGTIQKALEYICELHYEIKDGNNNNVSQRAITENRSTH